MKDVKKLETSGGVYVKTPLTLLYDSAAVPAVAVVTEMSVSAIPVPPLPALSGPATQLFPSYFRTCPVVGGVDRSTPERSPSVLLESCNLVQELLLRAKKS